MFNDFWEKLMLKDRVEGAYSVARNSPIFLLMSVPSSYLTEAFDLPKVSMLWPSKATFFFSTKSASLAIAFFS